jgi:hypothetical protein
VARFPSMGDSFGCSQTASWRKIESRAIRQSRTIEISHRLSLWNRNQRHWRGAFWASSRSFALQHDAEGGLAYNRFELLAPRFVVRSLLLWKHGGLVETLVAIPTPAWRAFADAAGTALAK